MVKRASGKRGVVAGPGQKVRGGVPSAVPPCCPDYELLLNSRDERIFLGTG
jgi:hypothetical protein